MKLSTKHRPRIVPVERLFLFIFLSPLLWPKSRFVSNFSSRWFRIGIANHCFSDFESDTKLRGHFFHVDQSCMGFIFVSILFHQPWELVDMDKKKNLREFNVGNDFVDINGCDAIFIRNIQYILHRSAEEIKTLHRMYPTYILSSKIGCLSKPWNFPLDTALRMRMDSPFIVPDRNSVGKRSRFHYPSNNERIKTKTWIIFVLKRFNPVAYLSVCIYIYIHSFQLKEENETFAQIFAKT